MTSKPFNLAADRIPFTALVVVQVLIGCNARPLGAAAEVEGQKVERLPPGPTFEPPPLVHDAVVLELTSSGRIVEAGDDVSRDRGAAPTLLRPRTVPGWEVVDAEGRVLGGIAEERALGLFVAEVQVVLREGPTLFINTKTGDHHPRGGSAHFERPSCQGDWLGVAGPSDGTDDQEPVYFAGRVWVPIPVPRGDWPSAERTSASWLDDEGRCHVEHAAINPFSLFRRGPAVTWKPPLQIRRPRSRPAASSGKL